MPVGFALVAGRLIWHASEGWRGRLLAAGGMLVPLVFGLSPSLQGSGLVLPAILIILVATALGLPIFAALGGAALLLFWNEGVPVSAVPGESYRLSASAYLPAVPLFTLGGYILAYLRHLRFRARVATHESRDRSGGQLRQAQPLCAVNAFLSGTWNAEGEIVFTDNISTGGGLYRVSEDGGDAIPVTTLDQARREDRHLWPHFLPDGRHFLYIAVNSEGAGVYVGSLDSGETTHLMDGFLIVNYALGHLLLARAGTLEAIPFDAANLRIEGEPVPIATDLSLAVSSSVNGVVAGIPSGQLNLSTQLVWFDRKGQELGTASPVVRSGYYGPWFSPDEERVVIERHAETGMNLWLLELSRGTTSRFTFDQDSHDQSAVWASDGSSIVYSSSTETGSWSLNLKSSSGSGQAEELLSASDEIYPTDWSPDGPVVIYEKLNQAGNWDVWLLPLIGDREPEPLLETLFDERHAQLSPDGRWITYVSNESGSHEVYVQSFPTGLGKWKISTDGGGQPGWKRDGTEIFYLDPDSNLMAVQVETTSSTLEAALPETLFELSLEPSPLGPFDIRNRYAAAGDGVRFLVPTIRNEVPASISVFLNWTSLLEENQ